MDFHTERQEMIKASRGFFSLLLCFLLTSCTSQFAQDPIAASNRTAQLAEKGGAASAEVSTTEDDKRKMFVVYADRPEYHDLITRSDVGRRIPRLRTAVPPRYPGLLVFLGVKTSVKVALLIDEKGAVRDVRIFEAPDTRFSQPALEAVRQWSYFPGSSNGHPDRFIGLVVVNFGKNPPK